MILTLCMFFNMYTIHGFFMCPKALLWFILWCLLYICGSVSLYLVHSRISQFSQNLSYLMLLCYPLVLVIFFNTARNLISASSLEYNFSDLYVCSSNLFSVICSNYALTVYKRLGVLCVKEYMVEIFKQVCYFVVDTAIHLSWSSVYSCENLYIWF